MSSFEEQLGQIIRTFQAICGSPGVAQKKSKETEENFDDHFPEYCQVQKVVAGRLLADEEIQAYSDIL